MSPLTTEPPPRHRPVRSAAITPAVSCPTRNPYTKFRRLHYLDPAPINENRGSRAAKILRITKSGAFVTPFSLRFCPAPKYSLLDVAMTIWHDDEERDVYIDKLDNSPMRAPGHGRGDHAHRGVFHNGKLHVFHSERSGTGDQKLYDTLSASNTETRKLPMDGYTWLTDSIVVYNENQ